MKLMTIAFVGMFAYITFSLFISIISVIGWMRDPSPLGAFTFPIAIRVLSAYIIVEISLIVLAIVAAWTRKGK
ncbi:hypothetical protein LCGC14_2086630 [marine sediment metagenome]|uniref:Uncharacterized protein n=1 Tax=marine sediment metagenome TaxID=412755 RepID=A0A0F9GSD0_9ZZZZ